MAYATDADLLVRVAAASSASADERAAAMLDARNEFDDRVVGSSSVRVHVLLAAHFLQLGGLIPGGESGAITARSMGEISASYAVGAEVGDGPHSSTIYGRQADAILRRVGHGPLASSGDPHRWAP